MKLKNFLIDKERIKKSANKIIDNGIIADHYYRLAEEYPEPYSVKGSTEYAPGSTYAHKSFNVRGCFKSFSIQHYKKQNVKVIEKVILCHDKFCKNCQNKLSLERFMKFYPLIEDYRKTYDPYHVTLTVPNVPGRKLKSTLDKMYDSIKYFMRYFNGNRKVNGIDFQKYGYVGAIRSLEINVKVETDGSISYHPHFHCIFLLKKGFKELRVHKNVYSFSNRSKQVTLFTDLEVLMQKLFYLIYNNVKVTKKNLEELPEGYSCKAIKKNTVDSCKEVFKYTLKNEFKYIVDSYEVFKTLYKALYNRRVIQGYGCLYNYDFENVVSEDEVEQAFIDILIELGKIEAPDKVYQKLADILNDIRDNPEVKYISKSSIKKALFNGDDK